MLVSENAPKPVVLPSQRSDSPLTKFTCGNCRLISALLHYLFATKDNSSFYIVC